MAFAAFVRTINYKAGFVIVALSQSPVILILVYPIGVTLFLFCFKEQLEIPGIRASFGQFYNSVDLKKGDWALVYYPITLFRRLLFVAIPYTVVKYPWNQV